MKRLALLAALLLVGCTSGHARADVPLPTTPVISGGILHDATISQAPAYDPADRVWIFSQAAAGRPVGDLTLTATDRGGRVLNWMTLAGFGHGISISVERVSGVLYVWSEAVAQTEPALPNADAGVYGHEIARFAWRPGATITPTSAGVVLYGGGQPEETPSLDAAADQIGVHYYSPTAGRFRYVVYRLSDFRAHRYVVLASFNEPPDAGVYQGWVLSGGYVYRLDGASGATPSITQITLTGAVVGTWPLPVPAGIDPWEAEGVTSVAGNLCVNIAGGLPAARTVNVVCQAAL